MLFRQAAGETPTLPEASASPTVVAQPIVAQPIDFVDGWLHLSIAQASLALHSVCAAIDFVDAWLHLSIAQASLALHSVCAAILHSSFFTLHLKKRASPLSLPTAWEYCR